PAPSECPARPAVIVSLPCPSTLLRPGTGPQLRDAFLHFFSPAHPQELALLEEPVPLYPRQGSRVAQRHVNERELSGVTTPDVGEQQRAGLCRRHTRTDVERPPPPPPRQQTDHRPPPPHH